MAYTRIEIDAPSSAVPDDFVEVTVEVYPRTESINIHRLHIIIGYEDAEGWDTSPITLADEYRTFQYQKFDCMFKMRYCKVRFYVYVYYETLAEPGEWHFDTSKDRTITVTEPPVPECSEGDTTCVGYDQYRCINGQWQLVERNSTQCGYEPEPPPPPPPPEERYWITVAEGNTIEELRADAEGKYIADEFRYVIETRGAPGWLLKGTAWVANQLTAPLNAIGVGLEYIEIKDGTIYIYMHGSPAVFSTTGIVLASMACFTIIAVYCIRLMIQQKLTEQQYHKLKEAEVKADVIDAIKDLPPEVQDTLLALWEAGIEPEKEGIDWEKYLKWGLVGAGGIAAAYLLLPEALKALRGLKHK